MRSALPPRSRRLAALPVLAAICALTLSACGSEDDAPVKAEPGASPGTSTATVTEPPETSEPTESTGPTDPAPTSFATLTDRLVPTADVPGLNAQWVWQDGETGPAGPDAFGACAKVSLVDIGASDVVQRSYFPPVDSDDNAAQQIAEFPDSATATRTAAVLKSWHAKCKPGRGNKVGAIKAVPVENGTAYWYLLTRGETATDEGRFEAYGVVVTDTLISVLQIANGGQDYNYPVGQEPMVGMVRAAAARLG